MLLPLVQMMMMKDGSMFSWNVLGDLSSLFSSMSSQYMNPSLTSEQRSVLSPLFEMDAAF